MVALKLVTFDITGTLLFFRTPILEKYIETGLKFGIKADPQTLEKNFKNAWVSLNKEYPNFGKESNITWQDWWTLFTGRSFADFENATDSKLIAITNDLIDFHTTPKAFEICPGAEDLLVYLKRKPIKLGVISNYDPRLHVILDLMGLKKYFDFVLVSYDFGFAKPDRRIFEEALKLGRVSSGKNAVHVGDDVDLDYFGAKNAGLGAALVNCPPEKLQNKAVVQSEIFEDFNRLKMWDRFK